MRPGHHPASRTGQATAPARSHGRGSRGAGACAATGHVHPRTPSRGYNELVIFADELRPPSSGTTEIRMIFAFDPAREAIFLVAGDESGNWSEWYAKAIPLADERFTEHLIALKEQEKR
ncbi:type II toxin-antitoxin system RelE/ParE family toxin [Nonomuraea sp. 3N208]|uniref:type II toxin-antitoxin system RelE/ParE family toxin n=1 Tax=Nonomuraea sp. 3N208 TaxID=3457421 RepID=UPI003FD37B91